LLPRAAHRFGTLTVIISLVGGAIFAIGNFLGAFNRYGSREENLLLRLADVYVPILLATALVVYILLRAFVFRKQVIKGAKKEGMSESEKALGLGYAVPIVFTAIAIIFGLVVYDVTRTDLQVWVWVVIQVIIAVGILLGTRFSSKARSAKAAAPRPKQTLAAGAANLNFVLSIVYGAVVSIMSFAFGATAIDKLRVWPEYPEPKPGEEDVIYNYTWEIAPFSFTWFFEEMFPALVLLLLAAVGIYLFITERNKSLASAQVKAS
jgi:heme/copper-type cytochrome/quinol oxidase subunit 2